ncbi:TIGR00288 family protein [Actinopolyspora alba]|uniref:TIGR00288 family protein n=1 Tax=Actinopolyspora alba TaxID=673379 RepID=A0A1I1YSY0_9ACTN|nr:NYN domain-containing protein [Actinopolyspora alba]SFE22725.1 TIGR00288 family protein [Actinopolyspora alba]
MDVESEGVRIVREAEARHRHAFGRWRDDPQPRDEQLALLIDFENLVLGAHASLPDRQDPVPETALRWLCRAYGVTTTRRAYGNWADSRFQRYQPALERNGVDLVQIGHGLGRKNGADIRMAVDAMETLIIHPEVAAFVLVSGDSDFSPLVAKLREFGRHIIGVGAESAVSARLVSVCSEYKLWGSIVARADNTPAETAPAPAPVQPGFRLADGEALLVAAMDQLSTRRPTASQLKAKMLVLDPSFDEAAYGCRNFRAFLAQLSHQVRAVGHSGHDIILTRTANAADETTTAP